MDVLSGEQQGSSPWWRVKTDDSTQDASIGELIEIPGPTSGSTFHKHFEANTKPGIESAYCTGLDAGKRTFAVGYLILTFGFEMAKTADAAPGAKGVIGQKSEQALSFSAKLLVKDGCSKTKLYCSTDRTGFELCF